MDWSDPAGVLVFVLIVGSTVGGMLAWLLKFRHGRLVEVEDGRRKFVTYDELATWHEQGDA